MASELKVDKITGVTTAGSISVTGEGNSTTTNLQQGLAKVFSSNKTLSGSTPTWLPDVDSFNVSSTTDTQTGYAIINMTNGFNNTAFASVGNNAGFSVNDLVSTRFQATTSTTDDIRIYDGGYKDASFSYVAFGDLA
tara:strand:+ start:165 stop:575 length:411 start_codon:yes stop_codon:yes gene_type:complete